ncbi:putative N-acetyltransferase YkwB [Sporosarcina sp. NCCP-2222]|uniref:GNAT family N-acetyltransferase n=1 Tax=Sporosarcina sp. NCCP-2222 TaxID=2935073 RepID=UPI00208CE4D4|nr:GNAT family N-acetyltransferase [Sporosarcina sp. NCCP-2222]GKV57446.1 putative N-acetyltransferase YkwB [Sporosarcina sp. NCCP-2222]
MYRSDILVPVEGSFIPVVVRNYSMQDSDAMIHLQSECFPPPFPEELWWNRDQLAQHVSRFPEGAVCVEYNGRIVGSITSLLLSFDSDHPDHTWEQVTDNGYIRNHDPNGDTLYIVDICIHPAFRKAGLGQIMMQAMYQLVVKLNLKRLLGGGRMPGYGKYAEQMTPEEYTEQVVNGTLRDPVLTFLLKCGRTPLRVMQNYLEDDESQNYALLMEWKNPFYSID